MNKAVFIDLETGGLRWWPHPAHGDPSITIPMDPVIQVAAIAVNMDTGEEIDKFERKVKFCEQAAEPDALKINHYDAKIWELEGVTPDVALGGLSLFLSDHASISRFSKSGTNYRVAQLAGHNIAGFDIHFLRAWFGNVFKPFDFFAADTLQAANLYCHLVGATPRNFKLVTLCEHFGIDSAGAHDALADVRMSAKLWFEITKRMRPYCRPAVPEYPSYQEGLANGM